MFKNLFTPIEINTMRLKNRIVMPAMLTCFANPAGSVTDRMIRYYHERAKGGAALITVEITNIEVPQGDHYLRQLSIGSDDFSAGLSSLADAIHSGGAKASIQICHLGRYAAPFITGTDALSPSPEPPSGYWPESREMEKEDIEEAVEKFASAAVRAKECGFDAVEIHGAHGYLICQFLSPLTNRREDDYGGDVYGRSRFMVEVIHAVREAVGKEFPLFVRLSLDEFAEGGITPYDGVISARLAEEAGASLIHVSAGSQKSRKQMATAPMSVKPGCLVHLASAVKERVGIPVIAVGRINSPEIAESIILEGKADIVAMGRALIADPYLPMKAESGNPQGIRPCIACNTCIDVSVMQGEPLRCAVNPAAGREEEFLIKPCEDAMSVAVVGGGPAGMEAARVASLRGMNVTIFERGQKLGGQLLLASKPPFKRDIDRLTTYLAGEVEREKVSVELGKEVDSPDDLRSFDRVIISTGASCEIPEIKGIERKRHYSAIEIFSAEDLPEGEDVIVIGGETLGVELAAYLSERGKRVTVTRRGEKIGTKMTRSLRRVFLDFLREKGVLLRTGLSYVEINEEGLLIRDSSGKEELLKADYIVFAAGMKPEKGLAEKLEKEGFSFLQIGDCREPRNIGSAIEEGFKAGLSI